MTDRELLELAAKAAGYIVESMRSNGGAWCHPVGELPDEDGDHPGLFAWNPLTDDGDALRLAVRLNLKHVFHPALNQAIVRPYYASDLEWVENVEKHPDPYAATRRAIVRAAAEIGRAA